MIDSQEGLRVRLHLLIDDELWRDLQSIDFKDNTMILRKAREILSLFYSTNRKFIKRIGNEHSGGYSVPHPHDIHLRMPIKIYRWLKDSHAGQNVNGMAQIVRAILCYYIELVRKFGTKRALAIFTGAATYRVKRAFVRIRRKLLTLVDPCFGMRTQLDDITSLSYQFIREFVILME